MAMKQVGVCLSGCGVYDGTEIHEAVLALLAIGRAGAKAIMMAPDDDQMHVIDHVKGKPAEGEQRSILVESARIARGDIRPLGEVKAKELDALVFPGGFGAAKNLSTFAVDGPDCSVHPQVERLIREMSKAGKPLGFMCIAPVLAAKVLGGEGVTLTIGKDPDTAGALAKMGATHQECGPDDCVVDRDRKVVSTPAYMVAGGPAEMEPGVEKFVREILALAS
jgi:enhancing lycopene biosynthesis protein 2